MRPAAGEQGSPAPASRPADEALMRAAAAGDMTAFAELWTRYAGFARSIARSATSTVDADDVVAESFARVLHAMRAGRGPVDSFSAYLGRTVRTTAIHLARQSRPSIPRIPDPDEHPAAEGRTDALDRLAIREAFEALPPRWREALHLNEVEGLSLTEISERLGITPGAVAVLTYRARRRLEAFWRDSEA